MLYKKDYTIITKVKIQFFHFINDIRNKIVFQIFRSEKTRIKRTDISTRTSH